MHTTSATFLEALRQPGNRAAGERFVRDYVPLLHLWARQHGIPDPDDFVHNVFVKVVGEMRVLQYDPQRGSFRDWLRTILLNEWRKQIGRQKRLVSLEAAPEPAVAGPSPGAESEDAEDRRRLVARALALVKRDFQPVTVEVFAACEIDGRRPADVARERGLKVGTVYVAISRVYKRLRQELTVEE
jgi:RNA polymerase sigma-70 factor (ECF subfamily)